MSKGNVPKFGYFLTKRKNIKDGNTGLWILEKQIGILTFYTGLHKLRNKYENCPDEKILEHKAEMTTGFVHK